MNIKIIISIILSAIILFSCNNDNLTTPQNGNRTPFDPSNSNPSGNPVLDDVLNAYDDPNLVGVIFVEFDSFDKDNNGTYTSYGSHAFIVDDNRTSGKDIHSNIIVNAHALVTQYNKGDYLLAADESPFEAYFGYNINKFLIEGSSNFPEITDSASFASPIEITNISYNQNISKSNDLVINWTGGKANELVQLIMLRRDSVVMGAKSGTYKSVNSSIGNSMTIPSAQLNSHLENNGIYEIIIKTYDPHYFTMSNGKKICFMGLSRHTINVNIVD
jgi:hypothetical protein